MISGRVPDTSRMFSMVRLCSPVSTARETERPPAGGGVYAWVSQEERQLCKFEKVLFHNDLRETAAAGCQSDVPMWNTRADEIRTWGVCAVELRRIDELGRKGRGVPL